MAGSDAVRVRRAASFARRLLAHDAARTGASHRRGTRRGRLADRARRFRRVDEAVSGSGLNILSVMRGLDPRTHPASQESFEAEGLPGSSPAMTGELTRGATHG